MSLLHLLGCDDDVSFDGKCLDKTVDNIKSYANSKFNEDEVDRANDTLSDILSCAESIDALENISNNASLLSEATDHLLYSCILTYEILNNLKVFAETYESDEMYYVLSQVEDAMSRLNDNLTFDLHVKHVFGYENNNFIKYFEFDFIPDTTILNRSDKSGVVSYVSGDWEFTLGTWVGYSGLKMTPKTIQYKNLDFCKAYDKVVEVGLDPKNISTEDYQLLKILDPQNEIIYNLFVNKD